MIKKFDSFINEGIGDWVYLFVKPLQRLEVNDDRIQSLLKSIDLYNVYLKVNSLGNEYRLVSEIIILIESEEQVKYILKKISEIIKIDVEEYKTIPMRDGNSLVKYMANRA